MAITVGDGNISSIQSFHIERFQRERPIAEVAHMLLQVIQDSDITDKGEHLHPFWLSLFWQTRSRLEQYLGPSRFENLSTTYESLEASQRVALNYINPLEERITFLLGAGASKPSPSDIPTVTELLPKLIDQARRLDREQVTSLVNYCAREEITNIEDLLTSVRISAFCSKNSNILDLVKFQLFREESSDIRFGWSTDRSIRTDFSSIAYLQDTLQVLFGLLSNLMLPAQPNDAHQAIADYLANNKSGAVITTNYDCCIDVALLRNSMPFSYVIDFANPDVLQPFQEHCSCYQTSW